MVNWFAVHPTSMGGRCCHVTGDNKGLAAYMFERAQQVDHIADKQGAFVAAFANANEGDVSPNLWGPREHDPEHDIDRMRVVATKQYEAASRLYLEAAVATPLQPKLLGGLT